MLLSQVYPVVAHCRLVLSIENHIRNVARRVNVLQVNWTRQVRYVGAMLRLRLVFSFHLSSPAPRYAIHDPPIYSCPPAELFYMHQYGGHFFIRVFAAGCSTDAFAFHFNPIDSSGLYVFVFFIPFARLYVSEPHRWSVRLQPVSRWYVCPWASVSCHVQPLLPSQEGFLSPKLHPHYNSILRKAALKSHADALHVVFIC